MRSRKVGTYEFVSTYDSIGGKDYDSLAKIISLSSDLRDTMNPLLGGS